VLIVGLLSLLWLASSQSTALASSPTTEYRLTMYFYGDGDFSIDPENPDSILDADCSPDGSCYITFSKPQNVTLEAEPSDGYTFAGWRGDCSSCGTNLTCTITVNSPKTCSVNFTAIEGGGDGGSGGGSDSGSGSGSGGGGGSGTGSGGGGCSMTGSASSVAGLWNILLWLSVPLFALVRRIRKK